MYTVFVATRISVLEKYVTTSGTIVLKISVFSFIESVLVSLCFCPLPTVITIKSEFVVSRDNLQIGSFKTAITEISGKEHITESEIDI
ncbi:hypothetical protein AGMMS49921_08860 [Endomicrobiia bacterium]|nr:hypothetical protein AGMMS49921_08860 [Endomicrobiia bacterium]